MALLFDELQQNLRKELNGLLTAQNEGNVGRARVHARRAAGTALLYRRQLQKKNADMSSAVSLLKALLQDNLVPENVKLAAEKLTTSVTMREKAPFTADPLSDAKTVIQFVGFQLEKEIWPDGF